MAAIPALATPATVRILQPPAKGGSPPTPGFRLGVGELEQPSELRSATVAESLAALVTKCAHFWPFAPMRNGIPDFRGLPEMETVLWQRAAYHTPA